MATRTSGLETTGAIVAADCGINLLCRCGHRTSLLPAQIAALAAPDTRLVDFKRRFKCSMCGRLGSGREIRLKTFTLPPGFEAPVVRTARRRH